MLAISIFFWISLIPLLRTFNTFPFSGNTPYKSLPITDNPAIAMVLAESPSVKIRVHFLECLIVPAKFASQSFGIFIVVFFLPSVFSKFLFSLKLLCSIINSVILLLYNLLINLSLILI